ncbi:Atp-dependent dna helicase snf21 [Globisporangium polare]
MAIRALVTARLPRHAMAPTTRFAAVAHLQQQLQQSAIARAAAFSSSSNGSDDEDAMVAPVVEENGVIASTPIAQATADDRLKFFALLKETQDKVLPEGIGKHMENTFELIGHRHVMLRDNTLKIISLMKDWENSKKETKGFVIDGERGSGKSFALQQIVQFARESNWLVLYVPNARAWCVEAPYVMKSPVDESKYDIDVFGVELLEKFLHCHGAQLSEIPLRGSYGDRYYPASFKAKPKSTSEYDAAALTLRDLVENGIKDEDLACTAVVDLRTELAQVTEFPVLIAVDEYNLWFQKTVFGFEGKEVFPSDITVIDALKDIGAEGLAEDRTLANGLFIAAVTENYPSHYDFKKQVNYRALRTTMRTYTQEELESVVAYYNQVSFLHDKPTPSELAYFRLMTKALPLHVTDRASFS